MSISKFSLLVIVFAVLIGAVGFWFWQKNTYSKEVLKLEIIAPAQVSMGQELTYVAKYKNNGDVRLEKAVLIFEYPAGALPAEGGETRITQSLEDIYPGQEQTFSFRARLFGKEGETKEARSLLQYTPRNLNAQFESETSATTVISQVPLSFELDLPSRIESGQQLDFALNYFSNSEYPLSDLRIKMEYPQGFTFKQATPSPIGESEWSVGLLNKAGGGRISLRGTLEGEVQEAKIFKASIGIWREGAFILLKEAAKGVEITRAKILIGQEINGSPSYVASPGDILHYVVSFKNVGEQSLENLFLVVALEGRPLDVESIKTAQGTFQQGDNSIVFEAKDNAKLRFLGKGEQGQVEFWVNVKEAWETFSPQDKDFAVRNRIILSDAREEFEVKVNSKIAFEQTASLKDQATYTVTWLATNVYNDVTNAKVRAQLPLEVALTGNVFPEGAPLTFDQASREVVWEVGDLGAGTGPFGEPASVSFEVRLTLEQSGTTQLIGEATITGDDVFTERSLSAAASPITTADVLE